MKSMYRTICFFLTAIAASLPACAASTNSASMDLTVINQIPGNDSHFDHAAIDPLARRLYVARDNGVMSIDLDTLHVTATLIPGHHVNMPLPLPNGLLLSTNEATNTATLAVAQTGKVIAEIPTGAAPDAAVYDPTTGLVFVMDADAGDAAVIDPKTASAQGRIPIGGKLEFAVADGAGHIYINANDKNDVAVLDTVRRKVIARYPLPGCNKPSGLGIDPANHLLLSVCANRKAVALDDLNGRVVATLDIDRIPDDAIFDPKRKVFFVPCARDGTLIAIAETNGTLVVVSKIPTAIGAHTGALDPKTGRLYLPAADFGITLTGFKQKAGTFRILVLGSKP